ncbi:MAG: PepSY domain-containing protein [Aquificaceae bacterium]|nr:PepSY domain-containing protein [Aquificaceae bacterium]
MKKEFALLFLVGQAVALECGNVISIEQAISNAKQHVGVVQSTQLSKNKKTGECHYRVRGTEGTAIIDAKDGKLLRFYRKQ